MVQAGYVMARTLKWTVIIFRWHSRLEATGLSAWAAASEVDSLTAPVSHTLADISPWSRQRLTRPSWQGSCFTPTAGTLIVFPKIKASRRVPHHIKVLLLRLSVAAGALRRLQASKVRCHSSSSNFVATFRISCDSACLFIYTSAVRPQWHCVIRVREQAVPATASCSVAQGKHMVPVKSG